MGRYTDAPLEPPKPSPPVEKAEAEAPYGLPPDLPAIPPELPPPAVPVVQSRLCDGRQADGTQCPQEARFRAMQATPIQVGHFNGTITAGFCDRHEYLRREFGLRDVQGYYWPSLSVEAKAQLVRLGLVPNIPGVTTE